MILDRLSHRVSDSQRVPGSLKRTRSEGAQLIGRSQSAPHQSAPLAGMSVPSTGMAPAEGAKKYKQDFSDAMRGRRLHAKQATVRIGLYDRRDERFFGLGSGAIISPKGHILTAAHIFIGPFPDPGLGPMQNPPPFSQMYSDGYTERFQGRSEARIRIRIRTRRERRPGEASLARTRARRGRGPCARRGG